MGKWIFSLVFVFVLTSPMGSVTFTRLCNGIVPENSQWIPEGALHTSSVSQKQFDATLDRLQSLYTAEIAARGGHFTIARYWSNGTVNAYADRNGSTWIIYMYGGFARIPTLTADGFAMVACHEIGHHLGGAPRFDPTDWASVEGEADYYATLKCLRRYFAQDHNDEVLARMTLDPTAVATCRREHRTKLDQQLCIRATMAGINLAQVFTLLDRTGVMPKLTTPDPSQVRVVDGDHPHSQCRLDTYFNGALCPVASTLSMDDNDFRVGSCADARVYTFGLRPRCWFAP